MKKTLLSPAKIEEKELDLPSDWNNHYAPCPYTSPKNRVKYKDFKDTGNKRQWSWWTENKGVGYYYPTLKTWEGF